MITQCSTNWATGARMLNHRIRGLLFHYKMLSRWQGRIHEGYRLISRSIKLKLSSAIKLYPCHLLSWLRSCIMNLILSGVSSGVIGSPTLSFGKKSFPGGPRPDHMNHLFDGCIANMVVLVVWWWSHPTGYGGTWVQIPLRANYLSNIYSIKNMIIWGVRRQGLSLSLSIYIYILQLASVLFLRRWAPQFLFVL